MSQSMGQYVDIDLYGSIGVETDCTKRQLTQAFDAEVLETLPNKNSDSIATATFQPLREAYDKLYKERLAEKKRMHKGKQRCKGSKASSKKPPPQTSNMELYTIPETRTGDDIEKNNALVQLGELWSAARGTLSKEETRFKEKLARELKMERIAKWLLDIETFREGPHTVEQYYLQTSSDSTELDIPAPDGFKSWIRKHFAEYNAIEREIQELEIEYAKNIRIWLTSSCIK